MIAVPAALAATCGAALSVETGPIDPFAVKPFAGVGMFVRSVGPGVLALAGVFPLLAARASVDAGGAAVAGAGPAAAGVLVVVWMRSPGCDGRPELVLEAQELAASYADYTALNEVTCRPLRRPEPQRAHGVRRPAPWGRGVGGPGRRPPRPPRPGVTW